MPHVVHRRQAIDIVNSLLRLLCTCIVVKFSTLSIHLSHLIRACIVNLSRPICTDIINPLSRLICACIINSLSRPYALVSSIHYRASHALLLSSSSRYCHPIITPHIGIQLISSLRYASSSSSRHYQFIIAPHTYVLVLSIYPTSYALGLSIHYHPSMCLYYPFIIVPHMRLYCRQVLDIIIPLSSLISAFKSFHYCAPSA